MTYSTVSINVPSFQMISSLNSLVRESVCLVPQRTPPSWVGSFLTFFSSFWNVDLPYLDAKTQYVHELSPQDILDSNAPTISLNEPNTVRSLRKKLAKLYQDGSGGGFPIVAQDQGGVRMWGYIAAKELEHGLGIAALSSPNVPCTFRSCSALMAGISLPASRVSTPLGHDLSWLVNMSAPFSSSCVCCPS